LQGADRDRVDVNTEDSSNRVARSIRILAKFIEDFEGFKDKSQPAKKRQETIVELKINNMVAQTLGPKRFDLALNVDTTSIEMVLNQVA
jgi:hypothetical protein